jgi:hypothetical protein
MITAADGADPITLFWRYPHNAHIRSLQSGYGCNRQTSIDWTDLHAAVADLTADRYTSAMEKLQGWRQAAAHRAWNN